ELLDYNEWIDLIDKIKKINSAYIDEIASQYQKADISTKEFTNEDGSLDKRRFISDETTQLKFAQQLMGEVKGAKVMPYTMGYNPLLVGDKFGKSPGIATTARTYHTMFNHIGLTSKVANITINPSSNYNETQALFDTVTNEEVDFPKRDTKLYHGNDPHQLNSLALTGSAEKLDEFQSDVLGRVNGVLFGKAIAVARGKAAGNERMNLATTKNYLEFTQLIKHMLGNLTPENKAGLISIIIEELEEKQLPNSEGIKEGLDEATVALITEYISNMKVADIDASPMLNMATSINVPQLEEAIGSLDYDTYREVEYQVFETMRHDTVISDNFYKRGEDGYKNLIEQTDIDYSQLDSAEKASGAFYTAMYYYDLYGRYDNGKKINTIYQNKPERSLQMARARLLSYIMPTTEIANTSKKTADYKARLYTYPEQLRTVLLQKVLNFNVEKNPEAPTEVKLRVKENVELTAYMNGYGSLMFKLPFREESIPSYEIEEKDAQGNYVHPELHELLMGKDNILLTGSVAAANRVKFGELIKLESFNIDLQSRIDMAKNYFNKHMIDTNYFNNREIDTIFTSLLVPYKRMNDRSLNVAYGRRTAMHGSLNQGRTYQSTALALRLAEGTNREWLNRFIEEFNTTETTTVEDDLPDFDVSVGQDQERALERLRSRRNAFGKQKWARKSVYNFQQLAKKDPKKAYEQLQDMLLSTTMTAALNVNSEVQYDLAEVIGDINAGNYEKFNKIYNSGKASSMRRTLGATIDELESESYGSAEVNIMTELYMNLVTMKKQYEKGDPGRIKKMVGKLLDFDWYAASNADKKYTRKSVLDLKTINLKKPTNSIGIQSVLPAIEATTVYNPDAGQTTTEPGLFIERARDWEKQKTEIASDLGKVTQQSRDIIDDIVNDEVRIHGKDNLDRARIAIHVHQQVWKVAETEWARNPVFNSIEIKPTIEGYEFVYKGEEYTEDKLVDRIIQDAFNLNPTSEAGVAQAKLFKAALQYRKILDGYIPVRIKKLRLYIQEQFDYYMKQGDSIALQEAQKLVKLMRQYDQIIEAIETWPDRKEIKYMPHNYNNNLLKAKFTADNFDKIYNNLVAKRSKLQQSVKEGQKVANKIVNETDEQLRTRAKNMIDKQVQELFENNPMMLFNPNWAERMVEGVPYETQTDAPIMRYIENFSAKFGRDMTDIDAGLYRQRSVRDGESQHVIEYGMKWFARQSENKTLHTRPISHSD
ncbi:MAG: hypothetical protein DRH90_22340, partial [Deltaproteobacteria bacterium]